MTRVSLVFSALAVMLPHHIGLPVASAQGTAQLAGEDIFAREPKHNHASCIVELPGGDLMVTWYRGSGERNADDVQIMGARLRKGKTQWEPYYVLADTPGYPDCNPALFAAPDKSLWLIWPTIIDHRWEGAILKFAMVENATSETLPIDRAPHWTRQGVLHITPVDFDKAIASALKSINTTDLKIDETAIQKVEARSKDLLYQRLGWMPRVHPTVLPSGRWIWPLYCDTFSASIMAISDDQGATWTASAPLIGYGNIQPSIVRRSDGTLLTFMRDNGPFRRIRISTSSDEGKTWSPVTSSELPNPGAGVEAVGLANGHIALIYNDTTKGRHSLAVSISDDDAKTWKWTRHVEKHEIGQGSYHYPSIMQASDGSIHASYTSGGTKEGSTIRHARFDEPWVQQGDSK